MKRTTAWLVLFLLAAACFSLATLVQPRSLKWNQREQSGSVLKVLLGDSRRLFANHFFIKADIYFHSGYYPSIFDQTKAPKDSEHLTSAEGSEEAEAHEKQMQFLDTPKDWVERFGRYFLITEHTHLHGGGEREILPWLRLSAELDPNRIDTYTVAAFWLRNSLNKPKEAEEFLREGLRNNPGSYELLFELGRLYSENLHDDQRARNVWELALRRWKEQESTKKDPDLIGREKILIHLARLEERSGRLEPAIQYLEQAAKTSPNPEALKDQIEELKHKLATRASGAEALRQPAPRR